MINIDCDRDQLLSTQASTLLKNHYMTEDETSPQEAFARASIAFSGGDMGLAQRIYDYASRGWFMFSSPILSNAPAFGKKPKAMPISCFVVDVQDTREDLVATRGETAWLTFMGGGVGLNFSKIRAISEKSNGPLPHVKVIDSQMLSDKQSTTRKGSSAVYLDVSHPDIVEFIESRLKSGGGDTNRKCFNINTAVNITNDFMFRVLGDHSWDLKCPHTGEVKETVSARQLWGRIIKARFEDGEPYLHFIDTANGALPKPLADKGLRVNSSNLCCEIELPTSEDRTAVCCLSSVNLEKWDEWKDTQMVADLVTYLDNVLDVFIADDSPGLEKARYSAKRERSIGIGAMGFHSLLQSKMIPFESEEASELNKEIFKDLKTKATEQTLILGKIRGPYLDDEGMTLKRNSHLFAIAPNANSSIITGSSPSVEPWRANGFTHRTRIGSHTVRNKYLDALIKERVGDQAEEVWRKILTNKGSIQDMKDLFSERERDVFKTSFELNQKWVIRHAAQRQPFICQSQSLNLFFPFGAEGKYVNDVHVMAWKEGLKGLYYLRTEATRHADSIGNRVERDAIGDASGECAACEG